MRTGSSRGSKRSLARALAVSRPSSTDDAAFRSHVLTISSRRCRRTFLRAASAPVRTIREACVGACAAAVVSLALVATADGGTEPPFTGAFSGTGRSCYGRLFVRTRTISWLTPFSQCQQVPYRLVEQERRGNERRLTFELERRPRRCRYGVIHLRHRDTPEQDIGWEVIGYASLDDYRADEARGFKADSPTAMSCSLVTE
jgi:hypothetical protein